MNSFKELSDKIDTELIPFAWYSPESKRVTVGVEKPDDFRIWIPLVFKVVADKYIKKVISNNPSLIEHAADKLRQTLGFKEEDDPIVLMYNAEVRIRRLTQENEKLKDKKFIEEDSYKKVLEDLLYFAESRICTHESTHRGGILWEICDDCGAKWADDEGGKPEFKWPEAVEKARKLLGQ